MEPKGNVDYIQYCHFHYFSFMWDENVCYIYISALGNGYEIILYSYYCIQLDGWGIVHDDVFTWKGFLHYWLFVRGMRLWSVDSPHKGSTMCCRDVALVLCWTVKQTAKMQVIWDTVTDMCIDGLVQYCSNSSALAMELLQSCPKPWIWRPYNVTCICG